MACGEIAFRRDSRRGGPFSVIPAAAAVSNAASRLSGMDVYRRECDASEGDVPIEFKKMVRGLVRRLPPPDASINCEYTCIVMPR